MKIEVKVDSIVNRIREIGKAMGAEDEAALHLAEHLVRAELSGHPSHGVLRLPNYLHQMKEGSLVPSNNPTFLEETRNMALLDGAWAFGQSVAHIATEKAIEKAQQSDIALVTMRRITHVGRLGEYLEMIAHADLIGLMQVGAMGPGIGTMAPYGGNTNVPYLSTNPWGIGIPADPGPVIFDGSMTSIAEGKVFAARDKGEKAPPNTIISVEGKYSDRPDDYLKGGTLAPLGGDIAGHKGYGMAIACALLGGLSYADHSPPELKGLAPHKYKDSNNSGSGGVTITVINPEAVGDSYAYKNNTTTAMAAIRQTGAQAPGDYERLQREINQGGLRIPQATISNLEDVEHALGITVDSLVN